MRDRDEFLNARARWTGLVEAGQFEAALALVEEALTWAEANGETEFRDRTLCNRAAIALELGRGAEHIPGLRALLVRATDAESSYLAAYTIARYYELLKDFRKGLFYAQVARDRAATLDQPRRAASLNSVANFLIAESRFEEAIAVYREALTFLTTADGLRSAVIGYNLGYCCALTGSTREGLQLLYSSLRTLKHLGAEGHAMKAELDLSFALLQNGQARFAARHAAKALSAAESVADAGATKNALYLLGASAVASGDRLGARRHFERLQQGFYPDADYLPDLLMHVDVSELVNLKA